MVLITGSVIKPSALEWELGANYVRHRNYGTEGSGCHLYPHQRFCRVAARITVQVAGTAGAGARSSPLRRGEPGIGIADAVRRRAPEAALTAR